VKFNKNISTFIRHMAANGWISYAILIVAVCFFERETV